MAHSLASVLLLTSGLLHVQQCRSVSLAPSRSHASPAEHSNLRMGIARTPNTTHSLDVRSSTALWGNATAPHAAAMRYGTKSGTFGVVPHYISLVHEDPREEEPTATTSQNKRSGWSKIGGDAPWHANLRIMSRYLLVLAVCEILAVATFESLHRRWAEVDFDGTALPLIQETKQTHLTGMFDGFLVLARPYFCGGLSHKGGVYASVVIILGVVALFLAYLLNLWHKAFWDLFENKQSDRFVPLMSIFILLITTWVLNNVYSQYIRAMLYIHWRDYMTKRFTKMWLDSHSHFLMHLGGPNAPKVDNPDQRLQEDVHLFVDSAITITYEFLNSLGRLIVFVPLVIMLSPRKAFGVFELPGWLLYLGMLYSCMGTMLTHFVGKRLIVIGFARQRCEADFRHLAMHVRDHSESITLYNSEAFEEKHLHDRFERIKLVWWMYMHYTKRLAFFTIAYNQTQWLVPFFILAPSYFRGDLSLGDLFQLTSALGSVCSSFDWFIDVYVPLTSLRATADRLLSFQNAMQAVSFHKKRYKTCETTVTVPSGEAASSAQPANTKTVRTIVSSLVSQDDVRPPGDSGQEPVLGAEVGEGILLRVNIAELQLPDGQSLWNDVNLEVQQGQHVLILGPSGSGKSVLFKTIAGVWPFHRGCNIDLFHSDAKDMFFLPQRPVFPKVCKLREALCYPKPDTTYKDVELSDVLHQVGLSSLLEECCKDANDKKQKQPASNGEQLTSKVAEDVGQGEYLDRVDEWNWRLSPGMQQRLAVANVLLKRPKILFLDEITSNVDKECACHLYEILMSSLAGNATVISISHDSDNLRQFHDVCYEIKVSGPRKELVLLGQGNGESTVEPPATSSVQHAKPSASPTERIS